MVDPWFRRYRQIPEPRLCLVCFPHAGGSAGVYRSWADRLPGDVEVLAVQYPGRQDRLHEPCIDRMDRLVDLVIDALEPVRDRPLALFGHSMGASVAHEVAVRLATPSPPSLVTLFVSARMPPRHHRPRDLQFDDEALLADIRTLNPGDAQILQDPDMRALMLPAIRADYRLADTHRPSPDSMIDVPVVAYVGDQDPHVGVWQMSAWSDVTKAGFDLVAFPGNHFYLVPNEAELVDDVARRLDANRPDSRPPNGGRTDFTAKQMTTGW